MNATQDSSPRRLDEKATRAARERQYAGIAFCRAIFGWTPGEAEARRVARRSDQGSGPVSVDGRPHPTRARWTRPSRRAKAKAQRIARRKNRP